MKALVLPEKNQPLILKDVPDLVPGYDEVIVKIHAAALNHRDLWIQKGQYAGLKYPITPGSDGAGVVAAIGSNVDPLLKGKEVIINPALNWGDNPAYQHPKNFQILGLPLDGTFAEYVKIPATNITSKPTQLSFEEAAAIPLAGTTAYRALFTRGRLRSNEKILITGIGGGVALFALQFALATNADVYVTSGSKEKIDRAIAAGATDGVNYKDEDWVEKLQEKAGGFDVIIDGAAGDNVGHLLNLASPGGRIIFYGATRGNPANIEIRRIFWKQLNVLGSTMGNPEDFQDMVSFVNDHQLHPIIDEVFSFADGEKAFRKMDSAAQYGKLVIKIA
ncbi:MAG: zinc-binding dehydrogenase [Bacteroidetes bacterium]|nr:zinc-binding dehydrogenase [Bacteroidota bacterium]